MFKTFGPKTDESSPVMPPWYYYKNWDRMPDTLDALLKYTRDNRYFRTLLRLDNSREKRWGNNASSIDAFGEMPKELLEALKTVGIVGGDLLPAQSALLSQIYSVSENIKATHCTFVTSPASGGKTTALVGAAADAAYHGNLEIRSLEAKAMKQPFNTKRCPTQRLEPVVILMVPNKSLAGQLEILMRMALSWSNPTLAVQHGGRPYPKQVKDGPFEPVDILIVTPGRAMDLSLRRKSDDNIPSLALNRLDMLIIDDFQHLLPGSAFEPPGGPKPETEGLEECCHFRKWFLDFSTSRNRARQSPSAQHLIFSAHALDNQLTKIAYNYILHELELERLALLKCC